MGTGTESGRATGGAGSVAAAVKSATSMTSSDKGIRSRLAPMIPRRKKGLEVRFLVILAGAAFAPAQAQGPASQLRELERAWLELRTLSDQLGVTRNLGA